MNNERIDELLAQARREEPVPATEFRSPEEFKQIFFRRARQLQSGTSPVWRRTAWGLAAAILLLVAGMGLLFRTEMLRLTREAETVERFHRLLALFGADSGIGTVNGEPVTFDRQGGPPSRLVKLTIYDRHNRLLTSLELAVSTDDYLELNRKGLKGALFLQQGPEQEQILEFDLALTLADGKTVTLGNIDILEPGRRYTAQEMGFRIEKRLLKI